MFRSWTRTNRSSLTEGEQPLFNPLITAVAGWSEAVEERARRLLDFQMGERADGAPVRVGEQLTRHGFDPVASARHLMVLPPLVAVHELTRTMTRFEIDGQPCPDPGGMARAALSYAGRAVTVHDVHPERRILARVLSGLFGL
jgi:hypothetical protein